MYMIIRYKPNLYDKIISTYINNGHDVYYILNTIEQFYAFPHIRPIIDDMLKFTITNYKIDITKIDFKQIKIADTNLSIWSSIDYKFAENDFIYYLKKYKTCEHQYYNHFEDDVIINCIFISNTMKTMIPTFKNELSNQLFISIKTIAKSKTQKSKSIKLDLNNENIIKLLLYNSNTIDYLYNNIDPSKITSKIILQIIDVLSNRGKLSYTNVNIVKKFLNKSIIVNDGSNDSNN